ncbi:hypothetical protein [Rhizobium sp. ICMP 5592]|uniref:hypothetical protein n=1 Tax=Rhizobium sp. ICMP 5592 TaxID=2292445 RepID=UPI001294C806|nr:hypothetical protein [Rhizobium sp. ICMP 5592]MQB43032.1 hypothetical protein [Rhizobium sp. ICMP 5592]
MEAITTYTRRENARRAGVEAGVPAERVKITVHKDKGEVRFGWKEKEPDSGVVGWLQQRPGTAANTPAIATETRTSRPHSENSTPKRPNAGGKCAAVWDYLDANPKATVKELREAAAGQGWNVNNAVCELYAWRKFMQQTSA